MPAYTTVNYLNHWNSCKPNNDKKHYNLLAPHKKPNQAPPDVTKLIVHKTIQYTTKNTEPNNPFDFDSMIDTTSLPHNQATQMTKETIPGASNFDSQEKNLINHIAKK